MMATLEPAVALSTCENALRELMAYVYANKYGDSWLEQVATEKQRAGWPGRAQDEQSRRKGVAVVPAEGLAYANFYDLLDIADRYWDPLLPALGKRTSTTYPLLKRFDDLRNTVAHVRPLLSFEEDLLSGIAGQIRNQVTKFMSSEDPAGEFYPRIEAIRDSFGHQIDGGPVINEIAGSLDTGVILRPGEVVTFTVTGTDPQERPLQWDLMTMRMGLTADSKQSTNGEAITLQWTVGEGDVSEGTTIEIYMKSEAGKYHRFGHFDHRAWFRYIVRPPR